MVHLFRQTVGDIANLYWPASRLPSFSLPWQDKYFAQKNLLPGKIHGRREDEYPLSSAECLLTIELYKQIFFIPLSFILKSIKLLVIDAYVLNTVGIR